MKNISEKKKDFQKTKTEKAEEMSLAGFIEIHSRFVKLPLDKRKRILNVLDRVREEFENAEDKDFAISVKSIFFDKHIKLVVASIREKYQISGKPTEADFYRICEGERITVVNSENSLAAKKLKVGVYFVDTNNDNHFLNFVGKSKNQRLRSQFHLLGYHFLHQDNLPSVNKVFSEFEAINDARKEEAALFAVQFLDVKAEEKR